MSSLTTNDVGAYLETQGVLASTTDGGSDWEWFSSSFPATGRDKAVAIIPSGGLPPATAGVFKRPSMQFLVRGGIDSQGDAHAKAQEIYDALFDLNSIILDPSSTEQTCYIMVRSQGDILWVGPDESSQRPQYSVNVNFRRNL